MGLLPALLRNSLTSKNCRSLHSYDSEQLALDEINKALDDNKSITVNLRNYSKREQLIYSEVTISPIFDNQTGKLKYFLGVHKDVTSIQRLMNQLKGSFD